MRLAAFQIERHDDQIRQAAGPVLLGALVDPTTEDVALNPDGCLFHKRTNQPWMPIDTLHPEDSAQLIEAVALRTKQLVDEHRHPVLTTMWPHEAKQFRFEGILPPIVTAPAFAIRTGLRVRRTMADYVNSGIITERTSDEDTPADSTATFITWAKGRRHEEILERAIRDHKNFVVCGATGSGKTQLGDMVLTETGVLTPADRIVTIEDTRELLCDVLNSVSLLTAPAIGIDHLACVRIAMRLRPTRIVVGEARGPEVLALLKSWNTGHAGGILTVHAKSAPAALLRIQQLAEEGTAVPQHDIIAQSIDLVLYIEEDRAIAAGRKVREIIAVTGYDRKQDQYQYVRL